MSLGRSVILSALNHRETRRQARDSCKAIALHGDYSERLPSSGVHGFPFNWIRFSQLNSVDDARQLCNRMIQLLMYRAVRGIQVAITKSRNRTEGCRVVLGPWRNAMALPSFSTIELQLLICVIGVVVFLGSFLAIMVSAIFGLGLGRLLYVGGRWCVGTIHNVHQVGGALPVVPHHSH